MATTTPNFGWPVPTSTDLVKNGATAIEALGDAIDASMADLEGGTTGQILAKNSNTDMDFVWIANDQGDITGVTATSPLTGGGTSGAITVGILSGTTSNLGAVQLSTSTSSTSTSLAATASAVKQAYDPAFTNNFYAGKNAIINGDFGVWQRGTTFNAAASGNYFADRWTCFIGGGTNNITQQTFSPGTAPVAGYESKYFLRWTNTSAAAGLALSQRIEDVRKFAGQTIVVSFWVKANASLNTSVSIYQQFGSGGSSATSQASGTIAVTTSWVRQTASFTVGSIAGKTIGTNSYFQVDFNLPNSTFTFDIWGVQVEAGSVATPFQTATGTIQGELAACQRYYWRWGAQVTGGNPMMIPFGTAQSTTNLVVSVPTKVTMRTTPTLVDYGGTFTLYDGNSAITGGAITLSNASQDYFLLSMAATGLTQYRPYSAYSGGTNAYLGIAAEL
jgi:hypothetical protein